MKKKGIRRSTWNSGENASSHDVGELARDVDGIRANVPQMEIRRVTVVYGAPFDVDVRGRRPSAVMVGQARVDGSVLNAAVTSQPTFQMAEGRARITAIGGLTAGTRYEITLLMFW